MKKVKKITALAICFVLMAALTPAGLAVGVNPWKNAAELSGPEYSAGDSAQAMAIEATMAVMLQEADANPWTNYATAVTPAGDVYTVTTAEQLAWVAQMVNTRTESFEGKTVQLTGDLNLSAHLWVPIGQDQGSGFMGTFDGGGKNIVGLTIDIDTDYVGLFGYVGDLEGHGGVVKNVKLMYPEVTGKNYVGAVAGYCDNGEITLCRVIGGMVTGHNMVGGIVGDLDHGHLSRCCASRGAVSGYDFVGGVAGDNSGHLEISFNSGRVTADSSYAWVGGVAGHNGYGGRIENCYNTGGVTWTNTKGSSLTSVGGVVGSNSALITNVYNAGRVSGAGTEAFIGALVGDNKSGGRLTGCYYDTQTSGATLAAGRGSGTGAAGKLTTEMKKMETFSGWNFNTWGISENQSYPFLKLLQGTYMKFSTVIVYIKKGTTLDLMPYLDTDVQFYQFHSANSTNVEVTQSGIVTGIKANTNSAITLVALDGSGLHASIVVMVNN